MAPTSPQLGVHHHHHLRDIPKPSSAQEYYPSVLQSAAIIPESHNYQAGQDGSPTPGGVPVMQPSVQATSQGGGGGKIKCVFLGDGAVGKTSLIISYTTNGYPSEYVPTAIDTYDAVVTVDGEPITLEMCDTPGQDDFDTLRPLAYPSTDVFLLCFSVVSPSSFANIREKWVPELKKSYQGRRGKRRMPPFLLIGTQSDLRRDATALIDLAACHETPVTESEARKLAMQLGCEAYIESSSLTQKNLKEVFDEAIVAGLKGRKKRERKAAAKTRREETDQKGNSCFGWVRVNTCVLQ